MLWRRELGTDLSTPGSPIMPMIEETLMMEPPETSWP